MRAKGKSAHRGLFSKRPKYHTLSNYASKCFSNPTHAHHTCKGLALLTLLQAHNTIYHVG